MHGFWRRSLPIAALILVYFAAGKFGLTFFGLVHPSASAVWPPTGVAIAALLVLGTRLWPGIFIGAFLVNVTTSGTVASSLAVAAGNTLEGLLAAYLVNRFAGGPAVFARAADVLKFAAVAGMLATAVGATIGVGALAVTDNAPASAFASIWLTWWLGDMAGAIVFTPLFVLWSVDRNKTWSARRVGEAMLLFATLAAVACVVFFHPLLARYPLAFLCLPPLVWAAFRFEQREVATAVALLSLIATAATATGHGSFVLGTTNDSLLVLQAFMALLAMTALPMAALANERAALVESERAARRDAVAASRSKDEFLAILGHELRNPLSAINAAATILDDLETDPAALRWLTVVQRQTRHLARLIDDLLDVARVTVNKMTVQREPLELSAAVRCCVQAMTATGILRGGRVDLDLDPVWIDGDADRVEQIVDNLLGNAVKYTAAEAQIRVTLRAEGADAVLSVADEGIGIGSELLPRVFEPFAQGEHGAERSAGGLGIGLTLVRRLAELHGGSAEAHSAGVGKGSVFVIRLPRSARASTAAPSAVAAAATARVRRAYRLLVVEDDRDAREALRMLLEGAGHEVYEAADGESGVAAALRLAPDLVVADIALPRLDGYEVARRLRAANRAIALVALTGYGRDEDRQRAYDAGFDMHLLKPVSIEQLHVVIEDVLGRQQGIVARTGS